ncbi:nucleotidyltransferase domain-containing protein [Bacillus canaveralius]|uniref:nucleotidyltransferase domain-containing protein n=1 Tax=Bacillus canaveralius TaxID=1403243 RepID=UPI00163AA723|nr:nucleotidyltransferase domain-containing protein [Bacillus canaveralius]
MENWLEELEEQYRITVLYACEAGSRAWNTDSKQSDFDIRFIFKYKDLKSYIALNPRPAVIDITQPFDAQGWDVRKALQLAGKSNASLYEWAFTPLVYRDATGFGQRLRNMAESVFSPYSLFMHYGSLMARNLKDVMVHQKVSGKQLKNLIQAGRSFFIADYIASTNEIRSPYRILEEIYENPDTELKKSYTVLVDSKKNGTLPPSEALQFVIAELEKQRALLAERGENLNRGRMSTEQLNGWLWELLQL